MLSNNTSCALCCLLGKKKFFVSLEVSSSLRLELCFSYISLWSVAHPFLLLPCSHSLWGPFILRGSFSAAGTDGTMRRYNSHSLASFHFPFKGVSLLLLAESWNRTTGMENVWLVSLPESLNTVRCVQYVSYKCPGFRKKVSLSTAGATSNQRPVSCKRTVWSPRTGSFSFSIDNN